MRSHFTSILFILFAIVANAAENRDNNISIKSIVPGNGAEKIQIVEQRISANIGMDGSYVECYYHLRNTGKQTEAEMGVPIMFFSPSTRNLKLYQAQDYDVLLNNRTVNRRLIYLNPALKKATQGAGDLKSIQRFYKQQLPAHIWRILFAEGEEIQLTVRFRIQAGKTPSYRYFDYQLQGSSLWKGAILHTSLSLNLNNISPDLILSISPKKYEQTQNQWKWEYLNKSPKDRILLKYETAYGKHNRLEQREEAKETSSLYYLNDKKISLKKAEKIKKSDLAFVKRPNDVVINIYTRDFVLKDFYNKIEQRFPDAKRTLEKSKPQLFDKEYLLILEGKRISGSKIFEKLYEMDASSIKSLKINERKGYRTEIIIDIKKFEIYSA